MDHRFYVGAVGSLIPLPDVQSKVDTTMTRQGGIHTALSGSRTIDRFGYRRSWTWTWDTLLPDQTAYVEAMQTGIVPGPLRLVDPRRANRLPEQTASGGSLLRSPTGFVNLGGTISYAPTSSVAADLTTLGPGPLLRGAIAWSRASPGFGRLLAGDTTRTDGFWQVPVLPGEELTLSAWVAPTVSNVSVFPAWMEYDSAGGATPQHFPTGPTTCPTGRWTQVVYSFTAGDGVIALAPGIVVPDSTPADVIWTTGWQLGASDAEQVPYLTANNCLDVDPAAGWRPGGGGPYVLPDLAASSYSYPGLQSLGLTLLEV